MNYDRFKKTAIKGRGLKKQQADPEELELLIHTLGASGGWGGIQLCEEGIMKPESIVYKGDVYDLYTAVDFLAGCPSLTYRDAIAGKLKI